MYPCYSLGLCAWSESFVLQCIELRSSRAQSALCEQTRKAPLVVFVAPVIYVVVIVLVVAVDDGRCLHGPVSVHHMVKYMRVRFQKTVRTCVFDLLVGQCVTARSISLPLHSWLFIVCLVLLRGLRMFLRACGGGFSFPGFASVVFNSNLTG